MRISRLYYPFPLEINQSIFVNNTESHYLTNVLRVKSGQSITVFNGSGGEYQGVITQVLRHQVTIELQLFDPREVEPPCHITLLQCISRADRMDFTLQKSTELGVSCIIPVFSERSIKLPKPEKKLLHWQKIIISACEQSGRNHLPELKNPMSFNELLDIDFGLRLFLDLQGMNSFAHPTSAPDKIAILIGPEGGMTPQENTRIRSKSFHAIQLGPRVLRTETAAISALSIVLYQWGDLGMTNK